MLSEHLNFLRVAIKDYKVGALTRSSSFVVKKILSYIKPEYKYFVEYGAGDGVVTKAILKCMPKGGKYIAIDSNENFTKELRKINDKRLAVIDGNIVELSKDLKKFGLSEVNMVISSIPFTVLTPKVRTETVRNTHNGISNNGRFLMFQYTPLMAPVMKKIFGNVKFVLEPRNLPPISIMVSEKK